MDRFTCHIDSDIKNHGRDGLKFALQASGIQVTGIKKAPSNTVPIQFQHWNTSVTRPGQGHPDYKVGTFPSWRGVYSSIDSDRE